MHVRTRLNRCHRAKRWPTTYTVRLASPALRTWRGSRPAAPRRILEFIYTVLPQNPPYVGKPSRKNSTMARSAILPRHHLRTFQNEDQRVLVSASTNVRVYRPRGKVVPRSIGFNAHRPDRDVQAVNHQGHQARAPRRASTSNKSAGRPSRTDLAAVREWAKSNGHSVSDRGRVSSTVQQAYDAAR